MNTLKKVLVVDDDSVVGKSFYRVLSNKGYAVGCRDDGVVFVRQDVVEALVDHRIVVDD